MRRYTTQFESGYHALYGHLLRGSFWGWFGEKAIAATLRGKYVMITRMQRATPHTIHHHLRILREVSSFPSIGFLPGLGTLPEFRLGRRDVGQVGKDVSCCYLLFRATLSNDFVGELLRVTTVIICQIRLFSSSHCPVCFAPHMARLFSSLPDKGASRLRHDSLIL